MGQKVNPYGFRLGIVTDWKSRWYAEKDYKSFLVEDVKIRGYIQKELQRAGISRIEIERKGADQVRVDIHTARPGIVIGRGGAEVDKLRQGIQKITGKRAQVNIIEVKNPEQDATLLAQAVADQLAGRVNFRRAMKRAVSAALKSPGVQGIRVQCAGRLGGAEMSRKEWYREGRVPLHTIRADIDYGFAEAKTKAGQIGVKVWIYKGDVTETRRIEEEEEKIAAEAAMAAGVATRRTSPKARVEAITVSTRSLALEEETESLEEVSGGKRLIVARTRAAGAEHKPQRPPESRTESEGGEGEEAVREQRQGSDALHAEATRTSHESHSDESPDGMEPDRETSARRTDDTRPLQGSEESAGAPVKESVDRWDDDGGSQAS